MTLKQDNLIEQLENGETSLRKAAIKSGYSENYADSCLYQDIRKPSNKVAQWLAKRLSKEAVIRDLEGVKKDCRTEKDRSNFLRALELQSRIAKLTQDNGVQQVNIITGVFSDEDKAKVFGKPEHNI